MQHVIEQLSKSLSSTDSIPKDREGANKLLGLETTSDRGSFCVTAGVHPDLPNLFIKVVPNNEATLPFVYAIQNGELSGKIYPKIESIIKLDHVTIIIMERVKVLTYAESDAMNNDEHWYIEHLKPKPPDLSFKVDHDELVNLHEWINKNGYRKDLNTGNYGFRTNGELVIFDPIM